MGKLTASPEMISGQASQRKRLDDASGRDEIAKARGFSSWAAFEVDQAEKREAKAKYAAKRKAEEDQSPEVQAAQDRQALQFEALKQLGRSVRFADVDSYTAAVRGLDITDGVMRVLAPNVHVLKLWRPGNGRAGVISREDMLAAADYASLRDSLLVGGAGRDPADIRVDGGGGGSTELALIHRLKAAEQFKAAELALVTSSIVPVWGRVIRRIVDWVCLDGGQPLDDFSLGEYAILKGENEAKASRRLLLKQGLGALCQHFVRR
ncbi:hypothetical protein [Maricaulis maris]|uniref:Uncharacterized protein n=1 Tax=Maricaulis maris TaxID=74318 RepID=A0A495D1L5_9PROT|nr:hypothetical protein [Maricaulis maris]RKQ95434.1 hypothetical protein C7435_2536 [Maricaulis maris]